MNPEHHDPLVRALRSEFKQHVPEPLQMEQRLRRLAREEKGRQNVDQKSILMRRAMIFAALALALIVALATPGFRALAQEAIGGPIEIGGMTFYLMPTSGPVRIEGQNGEVVFAFSAVSVGSAEGVGISTSPDGTWTEGVMVGAGGQSAGALPEAGTVQIEEGEADGPILSVSGLPAETETLSAAEARALGLWLPELPADFEAVRPEGAAEGQFLTHSAFPGEMGLEFYGAQWLSAGGAMLSLHIERSPQGVEMISVLPETAELREVTLPGGQSAALSSQYLDSPGSSMITWIDGEFRYTLNLLGLPQAEAEALLLALVGAE